MAVPHEDKPWQRPPGGTRTPGRLNSVFPTTANPESSRPGPQRRALRQGWCVSPGSGGPSVSAAGNCQARVAPGRGLSPRERESSRSAVMRAGPRRVMCPSRPVVTNVASGSDHWERRPCSRTPAGAVHRGGGPSVPGTQPGSQGDSGTGAGGHGLDPASQMVRDDPGGAPKGLAGPHAHTSPQSPVLGLFFPCNFPSTVPSPKPPQNDSGERLSGSSSPPGAQL